MGTNNRLGKHYHHSKETIEKIKKSNLGKHHRKHEKEALDKISEASKKLWRKEWYREKMLEVTKRPNKGQFSEGLIPWNKGLKLNSEFTRKTGFSKTIRRKVVKDKCVWCGSTKNLQLDHITAKCNGGSNTVENCQVLCKSCNLKKRDSHDMVNLQLKKKQANSVKS